MTRRVAGLGRYLRFIYDRKNVKHLLYPSNIPDHDNGEQCRKMTAVGGWGSKEGHFNIVKNLISFGRKIRFR